MWYNYVKLYETIPEWRFFIILFKWILYSYFPPQSNHTEKIKEIYNHGKQSEEKNDTNSFKHKEQLQQQ